AASSELAASSSALAGGVAFSSRAGVGSCSLLADDAVLVADVDAVSARGVGAEVGARGAVDVLDPGGLASSSAPSPLPPAAEQPVNTEATPSAPASVADVTSLDQKKGIKLDPWERGERCMLKSFLEVALVWRMATSARRGDHRRARHGPPCARRRCFHGARSLEKQAARVTF
ncbi:MAG TPA: hypothetical protein VNN80_00645, partial [Polyangiaceae bacterium]|nr:hypothetical protein [Polyangiaceae bacterium]